MFVIFLQNHITSKVLFLYLPYKCKLVNLVILLTIYLPSILNIEQCAENIHETQQFVKQKKKVQNMCDE